LSTSLTEAVERRLEINGLDLDGPVPAAYDVEEYLPLLTGKNVAIVANQTSVLRTGEFYQTDSWDDARKVLYTHIVDTLLERGVKISKVFAPEHGFRGTADAGAEIEDGIDDRTGLPIISLYGDHKGPTMAELQGIDLIVFDIQDVGARFYTYISTLHYVMDAAARAGVNVLVLDRPNPNGQYVDGPILEAAHKSFVGMHPVPIVHGMTVGEYAMMINGEGWLGLSGEAPLKVIKCKKYTHDSQYSLPIKPSPNLPNARAINLYPSLCLFEGTPVSVGRGTDMQFQVYGAPFLVSYDFSFIPTPMAGAKRPKHNGKRCFGQDLREGERISMLRLDYLIEAYAKAPVKSDFFTSFFTKLAGTEKLQKQVEAGETAEEIRRSWQKGLEKYRQTRKKYLLY